MCAHVLCRCFIAAQGRFVSTWKIDAPSILLVKHQNRTKLSNEVVALKNSRTLPGCVCVVSCSGDVQTLDSETLNRSGPAISPDKGTEVQYVCAVDAPALGLTTVAFYLVVMIKVNDIFRVQVIRVEKADKDDSFVTTLLNSAPLAVPAEVPSSNHNVISRATLHPKIGQLSVFWNGCMWASYKLRCEYFKSHVVENPLATVYCRKFSRANVTTASSKAPAKRRRKSAKPAQEPSPTTIVMSAAAFSSSGVVLAQLPSKATDEAKDPSPQLAIWDARFGVLVLSNDLVGVQRDIAGCGTDLDHMLVAPASYRSYRGGSGEYYLAFTLGGRVLWFKFQARAPLLANMLGRLAPTKRQIGDTSELGDVIIPPFNQSDEVSLEPRKKREKTKKSSDPKQYGPDIRGNGEDAAVIAEMEVRGD